MIFNFLLILFFCLFLSFALNQINYGFKTGLMAS